MKSFPFLNATLRRLTLLCLLITACISTLSGQDTTAVKMREVGIRLNKFNLEDFSFIYKFEKSPNKYRRIRFAYADLNLGSSISLISLGMAYGAEKRRAIGDKIDFIHGFEGTGSFSFFSVGGLDGNSGIIGAGLGYVLGLQYNFNTNFYVNLETIPSLNVVFQSDVEDEININAGFNSDAVALTFAYRFGVARK